MKMNFENAINKVSSKNETLSNTKENPKIAELKEQISKLEIIPGFDRTAMDRVMLRKLQEDLDIELKKQEVAPLENLSTPEEQPKKWAGFETANEKIDRDAKERTEKQEQKVETTSVKNNPANVVEKNVDWQTIANILDKDKNKSKNYDEGPVNNQEKFEPKATELEEANPKEEVVATKIDTKEQTEEKINTSNDTETNELISEAFKEEFGGGEPKPAQVIDTEKEKNPELKEEIEKKTKKGFFSSLFGGKKKEEKENIKTEEKLEENEPKEFSPEEKLIGEKRSAYVKAYNEWKKAPKGEKENKAKEADVLYKEYKNENISIAKAEYEKKKAELESSGKNKEEIKGELKKFQAEEIFSKYILGEEEVLNKAKVESWPPKEKGIFRKGLEKWNKLPKPARWAISASIATGIAVGFGVIGIGGAAGYAATRFSRGAIGGGAAIASNVAFTGMFKAWDGITGKEKKYEKKIDAIKYSDKLFDHFDESLEEIKAIREQKAKNELRRNIAKIVGSIGVGVVAGMESGHILNQFDSVFGTHLGINTQVTDHSGAGKNVENSNVTDKHPALKENIAENLDQNQEALKKAGEAAKHFEEEQARIVELATVGKGGSVWKAVYNQLDDRLRQNPSKFNLKPEDLDDVAKVKSTLIKETARILNENKMLNSDGSGIGIRDVDTKVILNADNTIEIAGGRTYDWIPPKAQTEIVDNLEPKGMEEIADNLEPKGMNMSQMPISMKATPFTEAVGFVNTNEHLIQEAGKSIDSNFEYIRHMNLSNQQKFFEDSGALNKNLDMYEQSLQEMKKAGLKTIGMEDISDKMDIVKGIRDKMADLQEFHEKFKNGYENIIIQKAGLSISDYTKEILNVPAGKELHVVDIVHDLNIGALKPNLEPLGNFVFDKIDPYNIKEQYAMTVDEFIQKVAQEQAK